MIRRMLILILMLFASMAYGGPDEYNRWFVGTLKGQWVGKEFGAEIRKTRSYWKACQIKGSWNYLEINGSYGWFDYDGHQEGYWEYESSGRCCDSTWNLLHFKYRMPGDEIEDVAYMRVINENEMQWQPNADSIHNPRARNKNTKIFYRIKESYSNYLRRACLAGKYIDSKGNACEFTVKGKANLNWDTLFGKTPTDLVYEIGRDSCYRPMDYFLMRYGDNKETEFGFKWNKGNCELYFVTTGEDELFVKYEDEPFEVLTPIK